MAIWFMDGFDHYTHIPYALPPASSTADILRKWTTITGSVLIANGYARQSPGMGAQFGAGGNNLTKQRGGTNVDTFIFGAAFQFAAATVSTQIVTFLDSSTEQVSLRADGSGHLTFTRNGTVLATSTNVISANTWYYIEVKSKINNSTGTYEVRVNGISAGWIPPATGANTRTTANSQTTGIQVGAPNNSTVFEIDDLYCADTTGSANTDFLGPQIITVLRPIAAGNYTQWTSNGFTNYGNVNEVTPDGDVSFNQDTVQGHKDSFSMSDSIFSTGSITGIQHVLYVRQDSGVQRTVRPFQRSGGVDYPGTAVNTSSSYQYILDPKDVDPATNSAYSITNLNAAEFGYELVS